MRKIAKKIHFLALKVEKTTSRCFFGQKSIFSENPFLGCSKKLRFFFSKIVFASASKTKMFS